MKDHRKRITGCLVLLLCLSVLLSGCGSSMGYGVKAIETLVEQEYSMAFRNDDPTAYYIIGAIQAITEAGRTDIKAITGGGGETEYRDFIIGLDINSFPLAYAANGEYWGFDVEFAIAVCEKLGWHIKMQPIEKENVYIELSSGNIDCAWGGIALDPDEVESRVYSRYGPYVKNDIVVAVRANSNGVNSMMLNGKKMVMPSTPEAMDALTESIRERGVMTPILVRERDHDPYRYNIIAGHRRVHAARKAGLTSVPAFICNVSRDEAAIMVVDSNLHRERILPSERARAYKMWYDAQKRQGKRSDLTLSQVETKLRADETIAEQTGQSRAQVQRYIRLTELIPEIRDMVDEKKIAFNPAVELSYLKPEEQKEFLEAMDYAQTSPSLSQAQRIKRMSQEGQCTLEQMCDVMNELKKDDMTTVTISHDVLRKYFPRSYTPQQMQDVIVKLLDQWQKKRNRDQSR